MTTFNQMAKAGTLVRKDSFQIRIEDLHIRPGFNLRDYAAADANGESYEEYVKRLMEFLAKGGQVPPIEVEPREEGGAWIVDGEGRYRAMTLGLEQGKLLRNPKTNEYMVDVRKFEGNDADKLCRIFTSNEGRKLTPLEKAPGMARLIGMGWTEEDVAYALGCDVQTVHNTLALRLADESVKQMIKDKQVSATVASQIIRQHGEKATAVLQEQLTAAQGQGKARITAGTMRKARNFAMPKDLLTELHTYNVKLFEGLSEADNSLIRSMAAGEIDSGTITVKAEVLMQLAMIMIDIEKKRKEFTDAQSGTGEPTNSQSGSADE